jgi:hypothetical protein
LAAGGAVLLLAAAAGAQEKVRPAVQEGERDGIHRMVIYSGPYRTVRLFADNLSPGEADSLRNLERAENELDYVDQLQTLRLQYLKNERNLEPIRAYVQQKFYGATVDRTVGYGYYGGGFGAAGYFGYPFYYGTPYGYYGAGNLAYGYTLGGSNNVVEGLTGGIGPEGVLKTALAQTIATQATPEYSTAALRTYGDALARAGEYDRLNTALALRTRKGGVAAVGFEQPRHAILTLKDGKTLAGTLLRDDGDFYVIDTPAEEVSIRKSEVVRVTKPKK